MWFKRQDPFLVLGFINIVWYRLLPRHLCMVPCNEKLNNSLPFSKSFCSLISSYLSIFILTQKYFFEHTILKVFMMIRIDQPAHRIPVYQQSRFIFSSRLQSPINRHSLRLPSRINFVVIMKGKKKGSYTIRKKKGAKKK